jgi:MerR family transcriptional regulator, mercuric resistance operon regulatory protein
VNAYTISKLAEDAGISIDRVRQYTQRGLLRPCERTASGYRIYDDHALARLRFVVAGREAGLSLEELAAFVQALDAAGRTSARRAFAALEAQVRQRLERVTCFKGKLHHLYEASRRRNARRAAIGDANSKEYA